MAFVAVMTSGFEEKFPTERGSEAFSLQETPLSQPPDSVCAIVVTYFPDEGFAARLYGLLPQVARVVVVDNTPTDSVSPRLESFRDSAKIQLVTNQANLGVSAALNQGLRHALDAGFKWVVTLDQDTQWLPDMVSTLLAVSKACAPAPSVIGGNYFDPRSKRPAVSTGDVGAFLAQKTVITSGSMVDVSLAVAIGGFREDYFIDQVDHEFCLRVRAHGHLVVITRKPVMTHSVGEPGGVRLPLLGVLPNHPPVRKYYIARNTVVTVMMYWRREPEWCLRRVTRLLLGLGGMALLEDQRFNKVRAFAGGILDALRGRMGPCKRASILHPGAGKL